MNYVLKHPDDSCCLALSSNGSHFWSNYAEKHCVFASVVEATEAARAYEKKGGLLPVVVTQEKKEEIKANHPEVIQFLLNKVSELEKRLDHLQQAVYIEQIIHRPGHILD